MCLLGPALPFPGLPPRWCCCIPKARSEPRSPLLLPVSISVNRGALAQRGLELSLEHRESAEPTQKVLMRGRGEAQECPPMWCCPSKLKHRLSFMLRSDVPSPVLPPQPPHRWIFKHSKLSNHLSAPEPGTLLSQRAPTYCLHKGLCNSWVRRKSHFPVKRSMQMPECRCCTSCCCDLQLPKMGG